MTGTLTQDLGLAAWYQPLNDITSSQGKIGGAAQKRRGAGGATGHLPGRGARRLARRRETATSPTHN